MSEMQPTNSTKYNVGTSTAATVFAEMLAKITASTHWDVQFSSASGIVAKQKAGDTTTQHFLSLSGNNISVRLDPAGTISDAAGTGISAFASPATSDSIAFAVWQFHEWADALCFLRADYSSAIVDYPFGFMSGNVQRSFFASDAAAGMTGQGVLVGIPIAGGGAGDWVGNGSGTSKLRVAANGNAGDWASTTLISGTANTTTNGATIGGRIQPEGIVACVGTSAASNQRKIGMFKYLYTIAPASVPGTQLFVGGVRKMQHVGGVHSTVSQIVMGVEDDFVVAGTP